MRIRPRIAATGTAGLLFIAGGVWGAAPVSAAQTIDGCSSAIYHVQPEVTYTIDYSACPLEGAGGGWSPSYSELTGRVLTWDNPEPRNVVSISLAAGSVADPYMGDRDWIYASGTGPFPTDQTQVLVTCDLSIDDQMAALGADYLEFQATFPTVSLCGGAGVPDWIQEYGRGSSDASCLAGWSPSWSQWPGDGRGGWVCTRSIPALG